MEKIYDDGNVLLKLVYYCNEKKEVYFKRADVTEYLINSKIFEIPNKQGFDGNLSYFGYDIKKDIVLLNVILEYMVIKSYIKDRINIICSRLFLMIV